MRVAILGFGSIAQHGHVPAWQAFSEVDVVAVADPSLERREAARAALPAARIFSDPLDLIATEEVDCVDICTPPGTHADLIVRSAARGIPIVVCEKPFVLSSAEMGRVTAARALYGTRVISVNNWRQSGVHRQVMAALQADEIGAVTGVEVRIGRTDCALGGSWNPRWRTDPCQAGGGILLDHGWHQIYLLLGWVDQPVLAVRASTRTVRPQHAPVEDEVHLSLLFPAAIGQIHLSWVDTARRNEGRIVGSTGEILLLDDRIVVCNGRGTQERPFQGRLTQSSYHPQWFHRMFAEAILDGESSEAERNFREAAQVVRIVEAAYDSARNGGDPVHFSTREMVGMRGGTHGSNAGGNPA